MASSSAQKLLSAKGSAQDVDGTVEDSIAKAIAYASGEQPSLLAKMNLRLMIPDTLNLHMYSEAISLKKEAEARQDALIVPGIHFVMEPGVLIGYDRQRCTQQQSAALSRPRRYFVQAEVEHGDPIIKIIISTAGLEDRLHRFELAYNRRTVQGENETHDLMADIHSLWQGLHPLLLLPTVGPGSRKQIQPQDLDAGRNMHTDVIAAETGLKEQIIHEQATNEGSDARVSDYPMTAGHVEIQAVKEAVKEVSNAVLSLKNVIKDLPSSLSRDHQAVLLDKLEGVSRAILRFPDCLTSLLVKRKAKLDATSKDRDAATETLRAAEGKMMAAEAKPGGKDGDFRTKQDCV